MKKALLLSLLMIAATLTASASKRIVVNLSQQRACAIEGGRTVFCGRISSGKAGHRTPTGHFHVLEKDIDHVSSKYPEPNGGAPMHYMLRVTGTGVAMHLGHVPNYPASHGCIRMQNGFAQRMYRWANVGTPITITYSSSRMGGSSYGGSHSSTGYRNPSNALASFMGLSYKSRTKSKRTSRVKKSRTKRYRSKHKRYRSKKRRKGHRKANPLRVIS